MHQQVMGFKAGAAGVPERAGVNRGGPLSLTPRTGPHDGPLGCRWSALLAHAAGADAWRGIVALGGPRSVAGAPASAWVGAGLPPRVAACAGWGCCPPSERRSDWVCAGDRAWPPYLDNVSHGPVALAWEGNLSLLAASRVAIVGARACTARGRAIAREVAAYVAARGGAVVSGLAWGIDAEAHLAAAGSTIAVLGQGLRAAHPAWQVALRRRVREAGGLLLSDLPSDQGPRPWTFPRRNRVLAALAPVVVVVEAGVRSGTRSTVRHALDMGREVYAVSGPPDSPNSQGCNLMIDEGAHPLAGPVDLARLDAYLAGYPVPDRPYAVRHVAADLWGVAS